MKQLHKIKIQNILQLLRKSAFLTPSKFPISETQQSRHIPLSNCKRIKEVKLNSACAYYAPRHKDVLGSGGIIPSILSLGFKWTRVVDFTLQSPCPWNSVDRRYVEFRAGRDMIAKRITLPLLRIECWSPSP